MTRINVGIDPKELCDQHLLAEYKELPRCLHPKFGLYKPSRKIPDHFKLGTGHMLWCAQFAFSLQSRFVRLIGEMKHRGFKPQWENPPPAYNDKAWTEDDEEYARPILIDRILDRLVTMKRQPTWFRRPTPEWVYAVLNMREGMYEQ
jgi:hypothetical protein